MLASDVMRRIRQGEGQPGLLDRLGGWVDELTTPRITVPFAAVAATLAALLISGQVQVTIPGLQRNAPAANAVVAQRVEQPSATVPGVEAESPAPVEVAAVAAPDRTAASALEPILGPHPVFEPYPLLSETQPTIGYEPVMAANDPAIGPRILLPGAGDRSPADVGPEANFVMAQSLKATAPSAVSSGGVDAEARRLEALDERLASMLTGPSEFAADFQAMHLAERELWLELLAQRASEAGRGEEIVAALRATGDASALELAGLFAGAVEDVNSR
jgi:hypothetical protein